MNDPVIRALREIVPVTRGQVDLGGRTRHQGLPMVLLSATEGRPAMIRRRWTALQAELAAEYGATHIVAEGSGHAVPLDRPALVAEAILGLSQ